MKRRTLLQGAGLIAGAIGLFFAAAGPANAGEPNDNLNATLWMQSSVEYAGVTMGAYRLATVMLDKALADKGWTAVPDEQGGNFADKPPAVILDVDETVLDNSRYQAWMVMNDKTFHPKSWGDFVNSVDSTPIPGSLAFTKYADSKGVKVFYVSNRTGELEDATRKNLEKYGYPMGGNVDTVLLKAEIPEWGSSKKSPRRIHVAKDYRVLLVLGDNFGDFVDAYKGSLVERKALMEKTGAMWGTKWIVLPNPSYGSWESAPFGHDYKEPDQRGKKQGALSVWAQ
ncbi:MAG: 5'-nucleotidase, lipoprotein e(P4) family [Alphaproteobacteria bacterium]|nr:5'-nucleotidase, lipoprotein e(P4) family [Alphaproteobacteria bacterium]